MPGLLSKKSLYIILGVVVAISSIIIFSGNYGLVPKTISESNSIETDVLSDSDATIEEIHAKNQQIVSDILQECQRDDECVYRQIKKISKTEPQDVVIFVANQIPFEWEKSNQGCHHLAHHISEFLLGYFNGNLSEAISHVGNACGNALYHGVVENYFSVKILLENIQVEDLDITSPCMNIGSSLESNLHQQCVHGLGHALATVYEYNVLDALKRCDEFQSIIDQDRCADGLFMENNNENFMTGGGTYDNDDIYYPCNKVDELYKFRCYFYQGYYILRLNEYSYNQSFEDCEKIPDEKFIGRCIGAVSSSMTSEFFYNDHDKIVKMCEEVNPKYQWECIRIAGNNLALYHDPEIGDEFCNLFSQDLTEKCIKNWKEIIAQHKTI